MPPSSNFDGFTLHRDESADAPARVHADLAWLVYACRFSAVFAGLSEQDAHADS